MPVLTGYSPSDVPASVLLGCKQTGSPLSQFLTLEIKITTTKKQTIKKPLCAMTQFYKLNSLGSFCTFSVAKNIIPGNRCCEFGMGFGFFWLLYLLVLKAMTRVALWPGLTQSATKHHTAACSLPASQQDVEENWKSQSEKTHGLQ